jgi:hypothetical protein
MWFIYETRHNGRHTTNPEKCNEGRREKEIIYSVNL